MHDGISLNSKAIEVVENLNVNSKKIVFSGVGKTSEEIEYAINKNILLINAESKSEILEIQKIAKKKKNATSVTDSAESD